jgi:flagellar hook protein FlgE
MLRSLSSAISGLQNHQTQMDIVGNNIANVNTVGYKTGRVTFEESFSQLLQGASRPPGDGGGTNPLQVGLGMSVGSIDTMTGQGNLQATGRVLDLAIQGNAFFGVSDGQGTYYTRNGGFQLDSNGKVVLPTNGMILQGKMADATGSFPAGTVVGDISVPFNEQAPAKATEEVKFSRNLNSEADAKGSVIYTQRFLHHATDGGVDSAGANTADDSLYGVFAGKGQDLGIKEGDVMTISCYVGGVATSVQVTVGTDPGEISTMSGLVNAIAAVVNTGTVAVVTDETNVNRGAIAFTPGADVDNLQITSNNPLSNPYLNKAMNVPSRMTAGGTYYTDTLRTPAYGGDLLSGIAGDRLSELMDASGDSLGLEAGDIIDITGMVGKDTANSSDEGLSLTFDNGSIVPGAYTTMDQVLRMARDTLKLPMDDGTVLNNPTVTINTAGTADGIPDGSMVFRGAKGVDFALNNITIRATNANNQNPAPTLFNANTSFTDKQIAADVGVFDTSITVYDDTG